MRLRAFDVRCLRGVVSTVSVAYRPDVTRLAVAVLLAVTVASADEVYDVIRLLRSRGKLAQISGAQKAGRLGSRCKRAIPWLVKLLRSPDWDVRWPVQQAFKRLGSNAIPGLVKAMKDKDPQMRLAVASSIKEIGVMGFGSVDAIAKHLGDSNTDVRAAIATALVKMKESALPALTRELGGRTREHRASAAWAMAQLGPLAIRPLRGCLDSRRAEQRAGAAVALGLLGPRAAQLQASLRRLLTDKDAGVRADTARALGKIKTEPEETVPALVKALRDADVHVREAAIEGVARFGMHAAGALVAAFSTDARDEARRALLRMGQPALEALTGSLKSEDALVREASVRTLGEMDPLVKVYVDGLEVALKDERPAVRRAAADALARRGAWNAVETLAAAAKDPEPTVRAAAVRALGRAGVNDTVVTALAIAIEDADPVVKLAAHASRWRLGRPSEVLALARGMLAQADPRQRNAAALALRPMGHAAAVAIPELVATTKNGASLAVVDALGGIAAAHGDGILGRAARYKRAPVGTRKAIDAALEWLKRYQDTAASGVNKADGRWHASQFVNHQPAGRMNGRGGSLYSAGVTGLALSAFLAVGRTDDPAVREGFGFFLKTQRPDGLFCSMMSQHFMIDHAYATAAMCEAWALTNDPRYRDSAQRAIDYCIAARNPELGWRYEPRGGENDTNVTVAVLHALALAVRGGLEVPADAFVGGGRWVLRMTDPLGSIGYNMPGGSCARPEGLQERFRPEESGAMVACGMWGLFLTKRYGIETPDLSGCVNTCLETYPLWRGSRLDMFYWHYGALVFNARPGKRGKTWIKRLDKALLANQRKKPAPYAGSWDPVGPWGSDGGRIYSTALNALSLASPYRFTPALIDPKLGGEYAAAASVLAKLAKSEDAAVSARARVWLQRLGG